MNASHAAYCVDDKQQLEVLLRQFRSAARHAEEEDQWLLHKDGFELALQKAGLKGVSHEQAGKLFALFDKDGSGSVDFREFVSGAFSSLYEQDIPFPLFRVHGLFMFVPHMIVSGAL